MPRLVLLAALLVVACLAHDHPPAPAADLTEPGTTTPEPLVIIKVPDMYKNGQFVVVGKTGIPPPENTENTEIDLLDPSSYNHDDWPEGLEPAPAVP